MEVRVHPETWRTMEADPNPRPATNCTHEIAFGTVLGGS